jgi:hypothetical protein
VLFRSFFEQVIGAIDVDGIKSPVGENRKSQMLEKVKKLGISHTSDSTLVWAYHKTELMLEHVCEGKKKKKKSVLFIDDTAVNVETAIKMGFEHSLKAKEADVKGNMKLVLDFLKKSEKLEEKNKKLEENQSVSKTTKKSSENKKKSSEKKISVNRKRTLVSQTSSGEKKRAKR